MGNRFEYIFVLGANHSLCKTEIITVLDKNGFDVEIIEASQETLALSLDKEIEGNIDINIFGSTVKLAKIYKRVPLKDFLEYKDFQLIDYDFTDFFVPQEKTNLMFGLSVYGAGCRFKDLNYSWYLAPTLCRDMRSELKLCGFKTGFLPLRERRLSTVSVDKNKLISQGFELILAVGKTELYIGKTIEIQDYQSYSFRDYGRPNRDSQSGMIPPKLAKLMINLANKNKDEIILDPFCGSGTILEEAILLGYKKIIGSDVSNRAINDSQTNIKWLFNNYQDLDRNNCEINIKNIDVTEISRKLGNQKVDAIITEPFLGTPKKSFSLNQIQQEIKKLEILYLKTFNQFKKILNKTGKIVIIFPVFKNKNEFFNLSILNEIKKLGFKQKKFLPEKYLNPENLEKLNLEMTDRGSIIYYRPDQTVSREIFIFEIE